MKKSLVILLSVLSLTINAAELDSFKSMNVTLTDSVDLLNNQTNKYFRHLLDIINKNYVPKKCKNLVREMSIRSYLDGENDDNIIKWLKTSKNIERFPELLDGETREEYKLRLAPTVIWREAHTFPKGLERANIPFMGAFINLNGYYVGVDKINHALGIGIVLFNSYVAWKKYRLTEDEIMEKTLRLNYNSERYIIGMGPIGKLLSYGDLEANYQGFNLYKSMCFGENPLMQKNAQGKWELVSDIDWRNYINGNMDELYNPNGMYQEAVERFHAVVRKKYCSPELLNNPILVDRFEYYKNTEKPSENMDWVRSHLAANDIVDNRIHTLENICSQK